MVDVGLGDLAENLGTLTIETERNFPALIAVPGVGRTDVLPAEVGFFLHQQPLILRRLASIGVRLVNFNLIFRRDYFRPAINGLEALPIIGVNQPELELRDA